VNVSRKMLLKNKLNTTRMSKTDTVTSYLMKIAELRDQIAAVGDTVEDNELVQISLNGFSPPWHNFVQVSVVERSYLTSSSCGMLSLERR
jgi:hypothetical protein